MYLHLGQDTLVRTVEVVGIFDLDATTLSSKGRAFLNRAEKAGRVETVWADLPKSFVLVQPPGKNPGKTRENAAKIIISPLGTATLKRRLEQPIAQP